MGIVVSRMLSFMKSSGVIGDDKEELDFYRYGIEITLSSILNIVLVLMFGLISKHLVASLIFLFVFISIRSFTGGYHASTYLRCNSLMCVAFLLVVLFYEMIVKNESAYLKGFVLFLAFCSIIVIAFFSPIENPNKIIPVERKPFLKMIGLILSLVLEVLCFILVYSGVKTGYIITLTLNVITILIIAAIIKERRNDR